MFAMRISILQNRGKQGSQLDGQRFAVCTRCAERVQIKEIKMRPDIVVISLESARDRRENITRQLDECGVEYSVFYGVDGRVSRSEVDAFYDEKLRKLLKGEALTRGQIGCFASHYKIWVNCFISEKPVIVLEDDARIHKDKFLQFINASDKIPERFECIRLFFRSVRGNYEIKSGEVGGFDIVKYRKGLMSTVGYYLNPGGAHKLINNVNPIFYPVDIYMERFWAHGAECYGVKPAFVEADSRFDTTIDYHNKKKDRSLFTRLRREAFNFSEKARRTFHNGLFKLGLK